MVEERDSVLGGGGGVRLVVESVHRIQPVAGLRGGERVVEGVREAERVGEKESVLRPVVVVARAVVLRGGGTRRVCSHAGGGGEDDGTQRGVEVREEEGCEGQDGALSNGEM